MKTEPAYPSKSIAWYTVGVMFLLYWLSILDRLIISLLVEPIKADLQITDFQFSMLLGLSFALFYALFGLPFGWMVDKFNRRRIIFLGVAIWSIATAACGLAAGYWQLFAARIGVGAGEAALGPGASSILSDTFPRERLTFAMTVFGLGATVGGGVAYALGGWFIGATSELDSVMLPLIGAVRPWQLVFLGLGLPGIAVGALLFTFPEPVRRGRLSQSFSGDGSKRDHGADFRRLIDFIKTNRRFFVAHFCGFPIVAALSSGVGVWIPAYMGRVFGWESSQIGTALGVVYGGGGIVGMLFGGKCVDWMFRRGFKDAHMRFMFYCALAAGVAGLVGFSSTDPWFFVVCILVFHLCLCSLPSVASAALQVVTPNEFRGQITALYTAVGGLFAISVGPAVIASFTDFVFKDEALLGNSMMLFITIACPMAVFFLWTGLKAMDTAVGVAEERDRLAGQGQAAEAS